MTTTAPLLDRLREHLGDRCLTGPARLLSYECDGLTHFRNRPLAVVLPESTDEVVAVVRACRDAGVPITPRGAGTCLSGGATPSEGGVVVELSRLRRILRVDADNHLAIVQPGVINVDLSAAVRTHGLCYAPDPSSQTVCTIGGNAAENAGGPHCLKYGCTSPHVLAMKVVLGSGRVITVGHASGATSGLDLRGFVVGSEGTVGVVTEITCRLVPLPQRVATLLAAFRRMEDACGAVSDIIAAGILPAAMEALDDRTIAAVEASVNAAGYPTDAAAVLLVELDGHPDAVAAEAKQVREHLSRHDPLRVESADDPEQRQRLWKGRKGAYGAMGRLAPDLYVQDAVVPRSKLPEVLPAIGRVCDELGVFLANVFHAGDGNLHPTLSYDGRDPDQVAKVVEAGRRIVRICLDAGGTLSGEHGIGLEKQELMPLLFSDDDLKTMLRLRTVFDPDGVMNPGKILPTPSHCAETRVR